MDALTKKKTDRFQLLHQLYEMTEGNKFAMVDMWELGVKLGLSKDETANVVEYLVGEGLVAHRAIGGIIAMTHYGVVEVEKALSKPNMATQYFPPVVNIMNIHSMVGSQIQQGTHGSTQTQTVSHNDVEAIRTLVESFKASIKELPFNQDDRIEAESELQTIEAQLKSSKPKLSILHESLKTLRNLLEGVASSALAEKLLPLFAQLISSLGS